MPESSLTYLEATNQMHCGPGEGGSKFADARVHNIADVVGMCEDLAAKVAARQDDREALRRAGAPESAFLPAVKGEEAPAGLPEALYFKVDGIEGRLGIVRLGDVDPGTRVLIRREKGNSNPTDKKNYAQVSFTIVRGTVQDMPKTDFGTIIIGRSPGDKDAVWTVHPGAPVRPAMGEFAITEGLVGPEEVAAGEKQPVRVMTVAEVKVGANLTDDDYIKIIPGNIDDLVLRYNVVV